MFNGLTFDKLILIAFIAAIVLGPEKLPHYAEQLARLTRRAKGWAQEAQGRVKDEMGEDFADVDWHKLDPRQYDPRRIIRETLLDDAPVSAAARPAAAAATSAAAPRVPPTAPLAPRRD
ncbi:MAG: Sec-independent protein translocase TatB, partial [Microbacterium sp.]